MESSVLIENIANRLPDEPATNSRLAALSMATGPGFSGTSVLSTPLDAVAASRNCGRPEALLRA